MPGTKVSGIIEQTSEIIDQLALKPSQKARGLTENEPRSLPANAEVIGDLARIPLYGVLRYREGGCDYSDLRRAVGMIREMDEVTTVILDINSPGGMAWGCEEGVMEMETLRDAGKRIMAWIDPLGASAAYWWAASADKIYALPSSLVGSIGAVRRYYDWSGFFSKIGITLEAFTSGSPGKIRGVWGKKTTEDDRAHMQESVDEAGGRFRDYVTARRGALGPQAFSGDVWSGRKALEMGLVDGLAPDLGTALAMFLGE